MVFEEDRWLVLSSGNLALPVRAPTTELVRDMEAAEPPLLGTLLVRGNQGLAIVHDFERDPSFTIATLRDVFHEVFEHCRQRGIEAIGMQPLGSRHGPLSHPDFEAELRASLLPALARIWVMTGDPRHPTR